LGSLPTISNDQSWLRASQRYPVLIDFGINDRQDIIKLRVGSQASVVVLTGEHTVFNSLASLQMWLNSLLTYAY